MQYKGYTLSYRSAWSNQVFRNHSQVGIWHWMRDMAVWEPEGREVRYNKRTYKLTRGQLVTSSRDIAELFDTTRQKVRGLLTRLEEEGMIKIEGETKGCIISLVHYEAEQKQPTEQPTDNPQNNPQNNPQTTKIEARNTGGYGSFIKAKQPTEKPTTKPQNNPHNNPPIYINEDINKDNNKNTHAHAQVQNISLDDLTVDHFKDWLLQMQMTRGGSPMTINVAMELEQFRNHYNGQNGKTTSGVVITNWMAKAKQWLLKAQADADIKPAKLNKQKTQQRQGRSIYDLIAEEDNAKPNQPH